MVGMEKEYLQAEMLAILHGRVLPRGTAPLTDQIGILVWPIWSRVAWPPCLA